MATPKLIKTGSHSRDSVDNLLQDRTVVDLYGRFLVKSDLSVFRDRLIHILYRFERGALSRHKPSKKEQRAELAKLEKAASNLVGMSERMLEDLIVEMEFCAFDKFLETSTGINSEQGPVPVPNIEEVKQFTNVLHHAFQQLLIEAEQKPMRMEELVPKTTPSPLDQLIRDVEGTMFGLPCTEDTAACYYDAVSEEYTGHLFEFTKILLDGYNPKTYHSDVALGKRIVRVLTKDK